MKQDDLQPRGLWAVAWWGQDPFDATCLPSDGTLEIRATPPDGARRGVRALCLAPALPEGFVLATRSRAHTTARVPPGAQAYLRGGSGREAPVDDDEVEIGPGQTLRVVMGGFEVALMHAGHTARPSRRRPADWGWRKTAALSGLVHGLTMISMVITPPPNPSSPARMQLRDTWVQAPPPKPKLPARAPKPKATDIIGSKARAEARGPASRSRARVAPKNDIQVAMNSGLLRLLKGGGALGSVFEGGLGESLNQAMDGLRGPTSAGGSGLLGLGTRGGGRVGPAAGGGSVGIGALTTSREPGRGVEPALKRRRQGHIVPGRVVHSPGLDKREVRRVMTRNRARLQFCYEKELNPKPNLQGKVSLEFTVLPNGQVSKVRSANSTLQDEVVEACLERVVRSLRFPKPRGGGVVIVRYPILFSSI